jgi:hypothetical protein
VSALLANASAWLRDLWRRVWPRKPPAPAPEVEGAPPAPKPQSGRPSIDDAHSEGEFYFRSVILDELDHGFKVLARVHTTDPDAYGFLSTVGAQVCPAEALSPFWDTEAFVTGALPAMGGLFLNQVGASEEDDLAHARLVYFNKILLHRIHNVEAPAPDEAVYALSIYYDELNKNPYQRGATNWCVAVAPTGKVRCLRQLAVGQVVESKKRDVNGHRGVYRVPARKWVENEWLRALAADAAAKGNVPDGLSPHDLGVRIFVWVTRLWEQMVVGSMVRVAVTKGGLTCCFAVNILRTPYFFADRDVEADGRKKIFHIVRTHTRQIGNRQTVVRTHFRGARRFTWNGYDVLITVPGWHHRGIDKFDIAGVDFDTIPARDHRHWIDRAKAGRMISAHIAQAEHFRSRSRRKW